MRPNRRNYYRILHVQPDAPTPVIKASFRAMMSKMRLHPDLGGDTAEAQLINEAYAALSDPSRRRRYDLTRQPVRRSARTDAPQASAIAAGAGTTASREYDNPAICAFCSAPAPSMIKPKSRCPRCESPG